MKKWRAYILFWILLFFLEGYIEFAWVRASLSEFSFVSVLTIVVLTELSFNLVRIPIAIAIERVISRTDSLIKKIVYCALILLLGLFAYRTIGVFFVLDIVYQLAPEDQHFFNLLSLNSGFLNIVFTSVVYLAFVQYRKGQTLKANARQLEKENLENELKFLKAQLNPHFLFNTLNNIYGLARRQDKNTPAVILQLSELLRFMLYEANTESITLEKELTMLEKYISLEKIRYNDRLTVDYSKSVEDPAFELLPLLITHMVENAFKHGISESINDAFIRINIVQEDKHCTIEVSNSKTGQQSSSNEAIGMKNIKRQLDLIYDRYDLDISEDDNIFSLKLKLPHSL